MTAQRIEMIRERITRQLNPDKLEIIDESARHAGHAGARSGGGHFIVVCVSSDFANKNLITRHRMVYDSLGDMMDTEIHALSIQAYSPDEVENNA
jgi:BolA protein